MNFGDIIPRLTSEMLAARQGKALREARAKALEADPGLAQREYQKAREVLLGRDFRNNPAGQHTTRCPGSAKAERRKARLVLVEQGVQGCPDEADRAVRLRRDMDKVEEARLAKHVYLKYDPNAPEDLKAPPSGFLDATPEELDRIGLKQNMLEPKGSQFRAAVYKKDPAVWGEAAKPAYEVVFRGSTLEQQDWDNNFAQNANKESSYYAQAVRIGNQISEADAVHDVQIVGHSLGGGLASAAQGGSGALATTFNAAGLHPETVRRYSKIPERDQAEAAKVLAYQVEGEVVTTTQETGLLSMFANPAVGQRAVVPPADPALSADERHGMNEVIDAIENQKSGDEAAIKACLAGKS